MKTRLYHKAKQQITITCTVLMLLCIGSVAQAQETTDAPKEKLSLFNFNTKAVDAVNKQYTKLQADVEKQSQKMLERMQQKEAKLKKKLYAKDSIKAAQLFNGDIDQQYADLQNKLSGKIDSSIKHPMQQYIPGLDSLQTSLDFLQSGNTNLPSIPADKLEQYKALSGRIQELQGRMQEASDIQNFIRERERNLKAQLQNTGLAKELTSINKEVYYYQQRLSGYKEILNDKDKQKETLLSTVRNLPAFQKFWQRNSFLSQLFPMPQEGADPTAALTGLQTRAGISAQLTQRFGGGPSAGSNLTGGGSPASGGGYMQQQMQNAQSQLNELKNKLSEKLGSLGGEGANSDMTQPDFRPSSVHTKSFLQRLEYGVNFQSQQGTSFLPATTDIAVTVGYKLSDNKSLGCGIGYTMGWGSGWKDIHLTNEGLNLRSYFDFKAKGSIWVSGGFEYNYMQSFSSLRSAYNNIDVWQRSALLGLTKKIPLSSPKGGKKKTTESKVQLLYDFLWNQQEPMGQQLVFRVGWGF